MWQDIDTCPKDGKPFLAAATYVMDEYDEDRRLIAKGKIVREPCLCYWLTLGDLGGGLMEFRRNAYVTNRTFTHWHPLPDLPKL